jgi:hypothetical protein
MATADFAGGGRRIAFFPVPANSKETYSSAEELYLSACWC